MNKEGKGKIINTDLGWRLLRRTKDDGCYRRHVKSSPSFVKFNNTSAFYLMEAMARWLWMKRNNRGWGFQSNERSNHTRRETREISFRRAATRSALIVMDNATTPTIHERHVTALFLISFSAGRFNFLLSIFICRICCFISNTIIRTHRLYTERLQSQVLLSPFIRTNRSIRTLRST